VTWTISVVPAVPATPYAALIEDEPVVIVSDVIRATTTAATAVARGNRCIPVGSVEAAHAEAASHLDPVLAGEQGGHPVDGFDFGNSPTAIDKLRERTIILLSSSGTPVLTAARAVDDVFVACLRNVTATADAAASTSKNVVFLAACTRGEFRDEDRLLGGWIVQRLVERGYEPADALTEETVRAWGTAAPEAMLASASVAFLKRNGHSDDLDFILNHIDDLPYAIRMAGGELEKNGSAR
jgi:2-phosphosulfolactate phosphatase